MTADTQTCKSCGREMPSDAKFCPYCGHAVPASSLSDFVRENLTKRCESCGKNAPPDAKVCPYCGHPFHATKPPRELTTRKKIGCLTAIVLIAVLVVIGLSVDTTGPTPTAAQSSGNAAPNAAIDAPPPQPPAPPPSTNNAVLDWTKPVFTKKGAALCLSKEGLNNLDEHVSAGVPTYYRDYDCVPADDGTPVKLLESGGFMSFVVKVAIIHDDGSSSDAWVEDEMLRN